MQTPSPSTPGRHRPHTPLRRPALLITACLVLAGVTAWFALSGRSAAIDSAILVALREAGGGAAGTNAWRTIMPEAMRSISLLGYSPWLAAVSLMATGYIFLHGRRRLALLTLGGTAGAMAMAGVLKLAAGRPRPDVVAHLGGFSGPSFPSSHALLGAAIYGVLALALGACASHGAVRRFLCWLAVVLALVIGLSRLFLGVHWPTDVLAGWLLGTAWAAGFVMLRQLTTRRDDAPPAAGA